MYRLLATGDLMLQRPIVRPESVDLQAVWDSFHGADHVYANLEVALTARLEAADKVACLRADEGLAGELSRAGIDVVSLANNHTADFGLEGLRDTVSAVRIAGLEPVGAGSDLKSALRPAILASGGLRIAFLGLACTLPNGCGAGEARPGIAPVRVLSRFVIDPVTIDEQPGMAPFVETIPMPGDTERAVEAVRQAHRLADIVVVGVHWGVPSGFVAESQGELATYQQPLGRALVDAGADAVIGHHPHVLHGVELYRERPIFYSLGNLLFHSLLEGAIAIRRPYPPYSLSSLVGELNHHGGVADIRWERPGVPSRIELIPIWLDDFGEPKLSIGDRAAAALNRVVMLSEQFGTPLQVSDGRLSVGTRLKARQD